MKMPPRRKNNSLTKAKSTRATEVRNKKHVFTKKKIPAIAASASQFTIGADLSIRVIYFTLTYILT